MKKAYKNTEGLDFELEYRKAEEAYQDLWRDYLIVTGWNTDFAERYNYLADILPSPEEIDLLLKHHLERLAGMKALITGAPEDTSAYRADRKLTLDRIDKLYKLKVAASLLQDNPIKTAKQFVKAQYAYEESKKAYEAPKNEDDFPWSWKNILCSLKKNKD
ncbi:hypothetical protein [Candidatus Magnetobacterium casense]|uniref:Uncharacterized protein n=1 Tax=Candidatus Magnetobacterium casense TaxID=1455061 RepID=A0ABS6RUP7_9BACT|nr:hypothetical protein [Candidatus Magnetobacterium casensis]MBV6340349.1 hypothetical protein [Candidatus Magnetobacterium casensis]